MKVYQIFWNSGGKTAEWYSTKRLANKVLGNSSFKGKVRLVNLPKAGRSPLSGTELEWHRSKSRLGGFVYRTRAIGT